MIICAGFPASSVYNFGAAVLRSVGDSKTPLLILATTGIVNVVFNLIFVIGFGMSVAGVAIATIIAQYLSAIWVVGVLIKRRDQSYSITVKKLKIDRYILIRILRIGVPIAVQSSLFSISNLVVTSAVNTFPPATIDAKPIAFNIEGITYTAMNGFSTAAMTFVGQNYGAKKYRRINRVFIYSLLQVAVIGILVSQIEIFFGREISMLYVSADNPNREEIIKAVLEIFEIMLATYFLCGIMEVLSGILKGLGYATISVIASLIGLAVRVLWILFVTPTEKFHTIFGLFVSYTISWLLTILLLLLCCAYVWHKIGIWRGAKEEKMQNKENSI
jgi:putative MATE family efflux protein